MVKYDLNDDLFLVGQNINKYDADALHHDKHEIYKIDYGVYFRSGKDSTKIIKTYALRIAKYLFATAALTHSTAFYGKMVNGRIFIGGNYGYKKVIDTPGGRYFIVQSMLSGKEPLENKKLFQPVTFSDPMGEFKMLSPTPKMILLQMMETTKKKNIDKNISEQHLIKLVGDLVQKYHGSSVKFLAAMEDFAVIADKRYDFNRLYQLCMKEDKFVRLFK